MKQRVTDEVFQRKAEEWGCQAAAIKAVCKVESPKGGFIEADPQERATILYEGHVMYKYLKRAGVAGWQEFAGANPTLVFPKWIRGVTTKWYGPAGVYQYERRYGPAAAFNEECAMLACSIGRFQVMGFNHVLCGYATVKEFWDALQASEVSQFEAFCKYVEGRDLVRALRDKRFDAFAEGYNGTGQVAYYGGLIRKAFAQFGGK